MLADTAEGQATFLDTRGKPLGVSGLQKGHIFFAERMLRKNRHFTGRDESLNLLQSNLKADGEFSAVALIGTGKFPIKQHTCSI